MAPTFRRLLNGGEKENLESKNWKKKMHERVCARRYISESAIATVHEVKKCMKWGGEKLGGGGGTEKKKKKRGK